MLSSWPQILAVTFTYEGEYAETWLFNWAFPIYGWGELGIFGLAALAFWIWMIVDCVTKKFTDNDKIIGILVIVLVGWIGALVYFFAGRRKGRR